MAVTIDRKTRSRVRDISLAQEPRFDLLHLLQSPRVAFFRTKARSEKGADNLLGERAADDPRPHAEDVHVVVLYALMSRVGVVAEARANSRKLVGSDRYADAATAHEEASLRLPRAHRFADELGKVRAFYRACALREIYI